MGKPKGNGMGASRLLKWKIFRKFNGGQKKKKWKVIRLEVEIGRPQILAMNK